eukprot:CAMPEP_0175132088 /NCGR_PEP_ID=MMETSP0087-20121206/6891_1 /TAXON_ID=136419 /ORGANISM="Unknown Unknown, Strain D1" /LENGTH=1082 /DNA_ID=CAMNT_0016414425 /DNA_START=38 /DNA_END=3287 /DNA_ORIENTATION=+
MTNEQLKPNKCERFFAKRPGTFMLLTLFTTLALSASLAAKFPKQAQVKFNARSDKIQERFDAFEVTAQKGEPPARTQTASTDMSPTPSPVAASTTFFSASLPFQLYKLDKRNQLNVWFESKSGNMLTKANLATMREIENAILALPGMTDNCGKIKSSSNSGYSAKAECSPSLSILNFLYTNAGEHQTDCGQGWCSDGAIANAAYSESFRNSQNAAQTFTQSYQAGKTAAQNIVYSTPNYVPTCPNPTVVNPFPSTRKWGDIPCFSQRYSYTKSTTMVNDPINDVVKDWATAAHCTATAAADPYSGVKRVLLTSLLSKEISCTSYSKARVAKSVFYLTDNEDWLKNTLYVELNKVLKEKGWNDPESPFHGGNRKIANKEMQDGLFNDMIFIVGSFVFVFAYMWYNLQSVFLTICGMLEIILSMPLAFFCWSVLGQQKYFNTLMMLGLFIVLGIGADDIFVFCDAWAQSGLQAKHISGSIETRFAWSYRRAVSAMTVTSATTFFAFLSSALTPIPIMLSFGVFAALLVLFDFILVITWFPACVVFHHRYILPRVKGFCGCCSCCCRPKLHSDDDEKTQQQQAPAVVIEGETTDQPKTVEATTPAAAQDGEEHDDLENHLGELRPMERFFFTKFSTCIQKFRWLIIAIFAILLVVSGIITGLYLKPTTKSIALYRDDYHPVSRRSTISTDYWTPANRQIVQVVWGFDMDNPIDRSGIDLQESEDLGVAKFDTSFNMNTDAAQNEVIKVCEAFRARTDLVYKESGKNSEVYCFMEVFRDYLQSTGRTFPCGAKFTQYALEKEFTEWIDAQGYKGPDSSGFDRTSWFTVDASRTRVTSLWVAFGSTLPAKAMSYTEGDVWMKKWDTVLKTTPGGDTKKFHHARQWSWTLTQYYLLTSAVNGIFTSFGLMVVVLLVATRNWWVSLIAATSVAGVCLSVFLFMVMAGWEIGVLESICMVIVVGMSVDYSVHLVHAYNHSPLNSRYEKARSALTEMGVSVLGGAITTFGASFFLFFSAMSFFFQFGLFIGMVILCSCAWSMLFLMASLMVCGPSGNRKDGKHIFGDIYWPGKGKKVNPEPQPDAAPAPLY